MSYLVFARKHRPQDFDQVVAQEHVTRTLRNALKNNRIASAYLLTGPRGTGKTTCARLLAKCVNCINGPTEKPCGDCPACVEISAGTSLDVLEIDAASNTGVDDMRTLRENVRYLPTSGKKRIYIIDEVHRLSGSAFDALLKTLEEPPEHVIFVLATTEPLKVPDTILSRTQRFDFRRVSADDLAAHILDIAGRESIDIEKAAVKLLARKADGSVRDSLSLFDQITAFAGNTITEQDVVNALGLVDRQFLFDFVDAIAAGDRRKVLVLIKGLFDGGVEIADFIVELLDHLRSLMILKSTPEAGELLDLSRSDITDFAKQLEYFTVGDILRMMRLVGDLFKDIKAGLDERLLLETTAVRLAELESTVRFEEILARLDGQAPAGPTPAQNNSRRTNRAAAPSAPTAPVTRGGTTPPSQPQPTDTRRVELAEVKKNWKGFLKHLKQSRPMIAPQLGMADVKSLSDGLLVLEFGVSGEAALNLIDKPEKIAAVEKCLSEFYRTTLKMKLTIDRERADGKGGNGQQKTEKVDPKELMEKSPRLKKLVDRVEGEIIGVQKTEE